jgi:hypothetical protein
VRGVFESMHVSRIHKPVLSCLDSFARVLLSDFLSGNFWLLYTVGIPLSASLDGEISFI